MKAIVYTKYGSPDVLKLTEVKKPSPKDNEVLIRIHATTVTFGDCILRSLSVPLLLWVPTRIWLGLTKPKHSILGSDLSGEVVDVGENVTCFKKGDQIFGSSFNYGFGAYAQYKCLPEDAVLAIKPSNLTYEESATVFFGAQAALYFLRRGNVHNGQKVLIYGASGAVGSCAVQLSKYLGAEVTGVCSTSNLELVKSLGADKVIDYTKEDFNKNDELYDIIFDTVGKSSFSRCINSLREKGVYLKTVHMDLLSIARGLWVSYTSSKKVIGGVANDNTEDLLFIRDLVEAGKVQPVIDRCYDLEHVAVAHRYVEKGHKKGNIVITVSHDKTDSIIYNECVSCSE